MRPPARIKGHAAIQHSDMMECLECKQQWDTNDPDLSNLPFCPAAPAPERVPAPINNTAAIIQLRDKMKAAGKPSKKPPVVDNTAKRKPVVVPPPRMSIHDAPPMPREKMKQFNMPAFYVACVVFSAVLTFLLFSCTAQAQTIIQDPAKQPWMGYVRVCFNGSDKQCGVFTARTYFVTEDACDKEMTNIGKAIGLQILAKNPKATFRIDYMCEQPKNPKGISWN